MSTRLLSLEMSTRLLSPSRALKEMSTRLLSPEMSTRLLSPSRALKTRDEHKATFSGNEHKATPCALRKWSYL